MTIQTDGFATTIDFSSSEMSSDLIILAEMEEKEVTPPGASGGGSNDTSTMRNTEWRTFHPKGLKTLSPCSLVVAYDPAIFDEMVAMVNDNQLITITFPDDSTLAFWGWIDEFTPNASVEGTQPTANITIIPSNMDADNSNAEIEPDFTAAP